MSKQTVKLSATNEAELKAQAIKLSKANPKSAVTVLVCFGEAKAYIYRNLSSVSVDTPDTRQMLATYGYIAFVNGELVKPTKGWAKKQTAYDLRTGGE